jgi:hypothetical protein
MELTQREIILICADAILHTVEEAGEQGAPSGVLYAATMTMGLNYHQYQALIDLFLKKGIMRIANHVLFYTGPALPKGGSC